MDWSSRDWGDRLGGSFALVTWAGALLVMTEGLWCITRAGRIIKTNIPWQRETPLHWLWLMMGQYQCHLLFRHRAFGDWPFVSLDCSVVRHSMSLQEIKCALKWYWHKEVCGIWECWDSCDNLIPFKSYLKHFIASLNFKFKYQSQASFLLALFIKDFCVQAK